MLRKARSRLLKDDKGTSAIEFALVFPLFLLFVFGVLEFGQGLKVYNELASAASRASRMVMLDDSVTNTVIEARIREVLSGFAADQLQVTLSTDTVSGKEYRVVSISYPYQFATPFLDAIDVTLSATSRTPHSS